MKIKFFTAAIAALLFAFVSTSAQARHHHYSHHRSHHYAHHRHGGGGVSGGDVTYLPHPPGVRGSAFCGAGAHYALTGEVVNAGTWAIADYWPAHYHGSTPVAHWSGHVAIIRQNYGDGTALMEDYNSGGHQSRLHQRSIAGYTIVNPYGGRYASM